jgi:trypsin
MTSRSSRRGRRLIPVLGALLVTGALSAPRADAIIGGYDSELGARPYQVRLSQGDEGLCGAILVSPRVVVTAAHCVIGLADTVIDVSAGFVDVGDPNRQTRTSKTIAVHPDYTYGEGGDIAVIGWCSRSSWPPPPSCGRPRPPSSVAGVT